MMTHREQAEQQYAAEKSYLPAVYYEGLVRAAEQRLARQAEKANG